MSEFEHPWGQLQLVRWPRRPNETLKAWDSADRYLLDTLQKRAKGELTLCVNDNHGALTLAAAQRGPAISCGDSWLARNSAESNAALNGLPAPAHCWPAQRLSAFPDQVLMRVPKSLALLEYQLQWLSEMLAEGTPVWLAGMDKHLPRQLVPLLQACLGNGRAEYGWKKARLFSAQAPGKRCSNAAYPSRIETPLGTLVVHAGVFSQQQLDIGARFFIEHLPDNIPAGARVADLGCGNGVVGLAVLNKAPDSRLLFCDESWLALESARINAHTLCPQGQYNFHHGDGLAGWTSPLDLILLNPPFHEGHVVGDHVARRLFRQAANALAKDGELRVIGNRHLGYHRLLGRWFSVVKTVASNRKFVVFSCQGVKS